MTEGSERLVPYCIESVAAVLTGADHPLMETELMKQLDSFCKGDESLYARHFSLYHVLYRIADEWGTRGYYLHRDCMRIRLIRLPLEGCCHYLPEEGRFCCIESPSSMYCTLHESFHLNPGKVPSWDPLRDFYLNPDNIAFGRTRLFEKIHAGILVYAFRRGEVENALSVFGLEKPDRKTVERRYRELALMHHPDRGGDESVMARINHAYGVLKETFVL